MAKKLVNIGDVFGTWTVIGLEVNDRKYNYNYICKCSCGNKRIIRKDKLVGFIFPSCDKCEGNWLIESKMELIKSRWNETFNGKLILSELELNKQYMWNCPEGHCYKDSIRMLRNDYCPECNRLLQLEILEKKLNENFNDIVDIIDNVCSQVWDSVDILIDETKRLIWIEFNECIIFIKPKGIKEDVIVKQLERNAIQSEKEHIVTEIDYKKKDLKRIFLILNLVSR